MRLRVETLSDRDDCCDGDDGVDPDRRCDCVNDGDEKMRRRMCGGLASDCARSRGGARWRKRKKKQLWDDRRRARKRKSERRWKIDPRDDDHGHGRENESEKANRGENDDESARVNEIDRVWKEPVRSAMLMPWRPIVRWDGTARWF